MASAAQRPEELSNDKRARFRRSTVRRNRHLGQAPTAPDSRWETPPRRAPVIEHTGAQAAIYAVRLLETDREGHCLLRGQARRCSSGITLSSIRARCALA